MDTDFIDKVNGVWGKVFVNLADFGRVFAQGGCATPSCFGPVNIQIHPAALLGAEDVAICLRRRRRLRSTTKIAGRWRRLIACSAILPPAVSAQYRVQG